MTKELCPTCGQSKDHQVVRGVDRPARPRFAVRRDPWFWGRQRYPGITGFRLAKKNYRIENTSSAFRVHGGRRGTGRTYIVCSDPFHEAPESPKPYYGDINLHAPEDAMKAQKKARARRHREHQGKDHR